MEPSDRPGLCDDAVRSQFSHGELLFGRYTWEASDQINETVFGLEQDITKTTNHFVTLEHQMLFGPAIVNQARASYTRNVPHNFTSPLAKAPTFSSYAGRPMGSIATTGLSRRGLWWRSAARSGQYGSTCG